MIRSCMSGKACQRMGATAIDATILRRVLLILAVFLGAMSTTDAHAQFDDLFDIPTPGSDAPVGDDAPDPADTLDDLLKGNADETSLNEAETNKKADDAADSVDTNMNDNDSDDVDSDEEDSETDKEDSDDADDESEDETDEEDEDASLDADILFAEPLEFVHFPRERAPPLFEIIEFVPRVLTRPIEPIAKTFGCIVAAEHDHIDSELDEHAIGLQAIPQRPPMLIEWNDEFLAPGWLEQGIETKSGAIWRPSLWVFGEFRTAIQNANRNSVALAEQVNRLDVFAQLNLSGTERVLLGMRPLDEETRTSRNFTGYDYVNGNSLDGWNADIQTLFFEGDFGEVFPRLDPYDTGRLDYGFSVGRMPLLAQQGLLINEDRLDAVTATRNTVYGNGLLNLRTTGVFAWNSIHRNSAVGLPNTLDSDSNMVALLTESDFAKRTINLDGVYVYGDEQFGNLFAFGASSIRRHYGYHNTYNTSLHLLASFPEGDTTDYAGQGELLFAQTSWTPHHTEDLIYLNGFWAIDQFTSPTRGPLAGNALGQTGVLFGGVALGDFGAPIAVRTEDVIGGSLGYQMFFEHTRQQLIWEFGGVSDTDGTNRGAIGTAARYQKAIGQHSICLLDGFFSKHESQDVSRGVRVEWRVKF